jgi:tight adherence protein B
MSPYGAGAVPGLLPHGPGALAVFAALLSAVGVAWAMGGRDGGTLRRARRLRSADGGVAATTVAGAAAGRDGGRRVRAWAEGVRVRLGAVGREALCVPAGAALAVMGRSPLPVLAGVAAVPLVRRALRARERRAAAERRAVAVADLCAAVAGEVRAGLPPHTALARAVRDAGWARDPALGEAAVPVLAAARFGGDVPAALHAAARVPGARGLAGAAACWQVAVDGGAGLAAGLDRVAATLRAERDQAADLTAQLAGPRSTAVMLALLPAFGVLLGTGLGAAPLHVLLHTPPGLACLVVGALLEWAGLAWSARITRVAAEAS